MLGFVFFPAPVFALLISLSFESVPGSVPLTGAGSTNATLNFGSVSAFEPVGAGVTRTAGRVELHDLHEFRRARHASPRLAF